MKVINFILGLLMTIVIIYAFSSPILAIVGAILLATGFFTPGIILIILGGGGILVMAFLFVMSVMLD